MKPNAAARGGRVDRDGFRGGEHGNGYGGYGNDVDGADNIGDSGNCL